jgi:hypothetical protein
MAEVPKAIDYQGRVAVESVPFTGTGRFRFALYDSTQNLCWANAPYDADIGAPATAVHLPVSRGLYSVRLGDAVAHPGMAPLDSTLALPILLSKPGLRLAVWFDDGVHGLQRLLPDNPLASTPYALMAETARGVIDGAIGLTQLGAGVATSDATAGTLVRRDDSGGFFAGAVNLTGPLSLSDDGVGNHGTVMIGDKIGLRMRGVGNLLLGDAGNATMTGQFNTAVGASALQKNTTGEYNTAVGLRALIENTTGVQNTALGVDALHFSSKAYNTAVGVQALYFTTGDRNIGLGYQAGFSLGTGSDNILIGTPGQANDNAVIRLGNPAVHTATHLSGNVTASGSVTAGGDITAGGNIVTATGSMAGVNVYARKGADLKGGDIAAEGAITAGGNIVTATGSMAGVNVYARKGADPNGGNIAAEGGIRAAGGLVLGGGITANSGISTTTSIWCDNYFYCKFGGSYLKLDNVSEVAMWVSDERLKQDIQTFPDPVETVKRLRGVRFHWNAAGLAYHTQGIEDQWRSLSRTEEDDRRLWDEKRAEIRDRESRRQTGFVAQEVERVFPEWVETDKNGLKRIDMSHLNAVLVEAIKSQQEQIEAQAKAHADLQARNAVLQRELDRLRSTVESRLRALEASRP